MTEEKVTLATSPATRDAGPRPGPADRDGPGTRPVRRPRLGFLGVGWIGRHRMEAVAASGAAEIAAIADPSAEMRLAARETMDRTGPDVPLVESLDALLAMPLDGIVVATPSALHAEQSAAALDAGLPVFCQKPLGRTADEVRGVVAAAERADLLLGVDLSYRHAEAFARVRDVVASGGIGEVYAADLVFHNAYGPDKPWFFDPALSGGGCVMDLGVHLVDLAFWVLGHDDVEGVAARLFAAGRPLDDAGRVEDFATARIDLATGTTVQIACSWNLPAGRDAVISASFFGTRGGARVRNVDGSFYDFVAERYHGTRTERLASPPDAWGGRAAIEWARRLAAGERFDPAIGGLVRVAEVLDRIYGR